MEAVRKGQCFETNRVLGTLKLHNAISTHPRTRCGTMQHTQAYADPLFTSPYLDRIPAAACKQPEQHETGAGLGGGGAERSGPFPGFLRICLQVLPDGRRSVHLAIKCICRPDCQWA
jgi:hypothetical protein